MFKTGLNIARFRQHIPLIEKETLDYFSRWGESGERGNVPLCRRYNFCCLKYFSRFPVLEQRRWKLCSSFFRDFRSFLADLFQAFSELIILTASRCLHGKSLSSYSCTSVRKESFIACAFQCINLN